jgi:hypothetical protein
MQCRKHKHKCKGFNRLGRRSMAWGIKIKNPKTTENNEKEIKAIKHKHKLFDTFLNLIPREIWRCLF